MEAESCILKATEQSLEHWKENEANFPTDPDIDMEKWWWQNCESSKCALCNLVKWKELDSKYVGRFDLSIKDCPLYKVNNDCCCPEWVEAEAKMQAGKLTKTDITKVRKRLQLEASKLREQ